MKARKKMGATGENDVESLLGFSTLDELSVYSSNLVSSISSVYSKSTDEIEDLSIGSELIISAMSSTSAASIDVASNFGSPYPKASLDTYSKIWKESNNKPSTTTLNIDTSVSSPLHPFALVSPSPQSNKNPQHICTEVPSSKTPINNTQESDEDFFPHSDFSSPSSSPGNLNISKRLHLTINKLMQSNHDLQSKLQKRDHPSSLSRAKYENQSALSNPMKTHEMKQTVPCISPARETPKVTLRYDVCRDQHETDVAQQGTMKSHSTDKVKSNPQQDTLRLLNEKDVQIFTLELEVQKFKTQLDKEKKRSQMEKEQLEGDMLDKINEVRQGSLHVLMNTKTQVHELLREVEEYKLRYKKLEASEKKFKNMYEDTVNLIHKETNQNPLFENDIQRDREEIQKPKEEIMEDNHEFMSKIDKETLTDFVSVDDTSSSEDEIKDVKKQILDIVNELSPKKSPSNSSPEHVRRLNQRIRKMGNEIKTLREQQGLKGAGYTVPTYQKSEPEDFEFFERRDDHETKNKSDPVVNISSPMDNINSRHLLHKEANTSQKLMDFNPSMSPNGIKSNQTDQKSTSDIISNPLPCPEIDSSDFSDLDTSTLEDKSELEPNNSEAIMINKNEYLLVDKFPCQINVSSPPVMVSSNSPLEKGNPVETNPKYISQTPSKNESSSNIEHTRVEDDEVGQTERLDTPVDMTDHKTIDTSYSTNLSPLETKQFNNTSLAKENHVETNRKHSPQTPSKTTSSEEVDPENSTFSSNVVATTIDEETEHAEGAISPIRILDNRAIDHSSSTNLSSLSGTGCNNTPSPTESLVEIIPKDVPQTPSHATYFAETDPDNSIDSNNSIAIVEDEKTEHAESVVTPIRMTNNTTIVCNNLDSPNNISIAEIKTNVQMDQSELLRKLVIELDYYKEEAFQSKCKVAELMEENKECLERLASIGTELLINGVGRGGKKKQKKRMMAVAKAAGDLECIRKTKKETDTDSLTGHTGRSDNETVDVEVIVVTNPSNDEFKLPETKEDATEIDSLLRDIEDDCSLGDPVLCKKKKPSKLFGRRKLKRKSKKVS